ncbi:ATP-dependent RNA helicase [Balamuthia mandrillaris]
MLNEWCQRNKWAKPVFIPTKAPKEGQHRCKVLLHNPNNKKTDERHCYVPPADEEGAPSAILARHTAAVVALHGQCGSLQLHQLLPPQFRELWHRLGEQAKVRKQAEEVKEARREERKNKEEKREKWLERLPQVFMSPTARQLVENVLKQLQQQQKQPKQETEKQRTRQSKEVGETEEEEENGGRKREVWRRVKNRLLRQGWKEEDINKAFEEVEELEDDGVHKTEEENSLIEATDRLVSRLLDWLCLYVPEHELPKAFVPTKSLEIGASSFVTSSTSSSPASSLSSNNDQVLSEEENKLRRLMDAAEEAVTRAEKDKTKSKSVREAEEEDVAQLLCEACKTKALEGNPTSIPCECSSEELHSQRMDEMMALEAILGDQLQKEESEEDANPEATLRFRIQLSPESPSSPLRSLLVIIPPTTRSKYPFQLPLFLPEFAVDANSNVSRQGKMRVFLAAVKEASGIMGSPMIYSLVLWLQSDAASELASSSSSPSPLLSSSAAASPSPLLSSSSLQKGRNNGSSQKQQAPIKSINRKKPLPRDKTIPSLSPSEKQRLNELLKAKQEELLLSPSHQKMLKVRQHLPAWQKRKEFLSALHSQQVLVVTGATGCGKSTQIPQYVLDDMIQRGCGAGCNIICTQPRRISAVGLASRVAQERGENVGQTVGYQIRLESVRSQDTRLTFCTTGILLRRLSGGERSASLSDVSHIIVDEVHERSVESDFLLIILKRLLRTRPNIKLILMSATVEAETFAKYFTSINKNNNSQSIVNIPGFTHPVREFYLEDTIEMMNLSADCLSTGGRKTKKTKALKEEEEKRRAELERQLCPYASQHYHQTDSYSSNTIDVLAQISEDKIDFGVLENLIWFLCSHPERFPELKDEEIPKNEQETKEETSAAALGAVLVFLPGIGDILNLYQRLKHSASSFATKVWVLPLHSSISSAEQQKVFERPPPGTRKIILATNIAETSITINDVRIVIDTGKMNELQYDPMSHMTCLTETWVANANAVQRRGRAGRVSQGLCFFMYTRQRANSFPAQRPPEILRVPLEQLCLQIKQMDGHASIQTFLQEALEPPSFESIKAAIKALQQANALSPNEELTALGHHLAFLPVDVHIGKLLLFGAIFRCLDPILTIAAFMSSRSPFYSPVDRREEANKAKQALATSNSDHLTMLNAYAGWLAARKSGKAAEYAYCNENFISATTLKEVIDLKIQYVELLSEIGFLHEQHRSNIARAIRNANHQQKKAWRWDGVRDFLGEEWNANADDRRVLTAVLCCGLYPNVVSIRSPETKFKQVLPGTIAQPHEAKELKFFTRDDGRVFIHPQSVNFVEGNYSSPWLLYSQKVKTSKVFIRECTMVSHYPLLLFGGDVSVVHHPQQPLLQVDTWIQFKADSRIAVLVKAIRKELDVLLERKIKDPALDIEESPLVRLIVQLVVSDGLIGPSEVGLWTF